jgi:hypothetical protein
MGTNELPGTSQGFLTRSDAARRLGVTTTTIRRFEGTHLHPRVAADGTRLFTADEVERLARSRAVKPAPEASGEVAAEAFRLFRLGYTLEEIVMRLKQTPATIHHLFDEWCRDL